MLIKGRFGWKLIGVNGVICVRRVSGPSLAAVRTSPGVRARLVIFFWLFVLEVGVHVVG